MLRNLGFYMCLLAVFMLGCGQNPEILPTPPSPDAGDSILPEMETAPPGQSEETESETPVTPEEPVSLDIHSWEETQAFVSAAKGKIVVVDLWATYCAPCLVEFPNLVQLHKDHADQITCLSVSLDYQGFEDQPVESYSDSVLAVLKKQGATFQNILCSTDADTIYNEKLKQGSIPVVLIYDQQGTLAAQFPNPENPAEFTYQADVIPLVQKLLKQN